jgi:hypothetical protein
MTNPYLQPVISVWTRIVGLVLLLATSVLAVVLARGLIGLATHEGARRHFTSSSAIFALILLALGGFCGQAGFRLAFNRPDRNGTLFSSTGWMAIGTGLVAMAGLMAFAILSVRRPVGNDILMIAVLSGFGVWCFVLACRR